MMIQSTPLDAESESSVTEVIDAGFTVHRALGPGFLESIYRTALHLELDARHIPFECEKRLKCCIEPTEFRANGSTSLLLAAFSLN